jgi:hypothetical protein
MKASCTRRSSRAACGAVALASMSTRVSTLMLRGAWPIDSGVGSRQGPGPRPDSTERSSRHSEGTDHEPGL